MDPYIGEIRMFAGAYAPEDWAFCNGGLIAIQNNEALFALIGTLYGGDGVTNFALPNLQWRLPVGYSDTAPPGLTQSYPLAAPGGSYAVSLSTTSMPAHTHAFLASAASATTTVPGAGLTYATAPSNFTSYIAGAATLVTLNASAISSFGGGQPHTNVMPTIFISYIISLKGIFPTT